jgi:hypothetical protein
LGKGHLSKVLCFQTDLKINANLKTLPNPTDPSKLKVTLGHILRAPLKLCHFIRQLFQMFFGSGCEPEQVALESYEFEVVDDGDWFSVGDPDPVDLPQASPDLAKGPAAGFQAGLIVSPARTLGNETEIEIETKTMAPERLELAEGEVLLASPTSAAHFNAGSIIETFKRMIGGKPTRQALSSLRGLFPCTGPITRNQRRSWDEMAAAFEVCAVQIHAALANPAISCEVARRLVNGSQSARDREHRSMNAAIFLFAPRV